jgi:hypothetical protein
LDARSVSPSAVGAVLVMVRRSVATSAPGVMVSALASEWMDVRSASPSAAGVATATVRRSVAETARTSVQRTVAVAALDEMASASVDESSERT